MEAATEMYGDQALAQAAFDAGVQLVTCYPGTPGSNPAARIAEAAPDHGVYFEWSVNERVALEIGIGASMAGKRALVCVKSVGMNVLLDPLMVLNLSGAHGGLVILLGDDPGAYGSQNDQDSRWIARLAELPLLEPDTPARGYELLIQAFTISERFQSAVILRITRSFVHQHGAVYTSPGPPSKPDLGLTKDRDRFFPAPHNAVRLHRGLHARLDEIAAWMDGQYPQAGGERAQRAGVLAAGLASAKLRDVLGGGVRDNLRVLALNHLFPLPAASLGRFLSGLDRLLVLEENDPFVELHVGALAQALGLPLKIFGQGSGHLPGGGELYRWQIRSALERFKPGLPALEPFAKDGEAQERPPRTSRCRPEFYNRLFDLLEAESAELGVEPVVVVDPGCQVTLAGRANAKFAMGSAVAVAQGLRQAGVPGPAVAVIGDSAFFHSSVPAVCNAAVAGSDLTIVIVDNRGALTTGLQPSPHARVPRPGGLPVGIEISRLVRACGVREVAVVPGGSDWEDVRAALQGSLRSSELSCVILEVLEF